MAKNNPHEGKMLLDIMRGNGFIDGTVPGGGSPHLKSREDGAKALYKKLREQEVAKIDVSGLDDAAKNAKINAALPDIKEGIIKNLLADLKTLNNNEDISDDAKAKVRELINNAADANAFGQAVKDNHADILVALTAGDTTYPSADNGGRQVSNFERMVNVEDGIIADVTGLMRTTGSKGLTNFLGIEHKDDMGKFEFPQSRADIAAFFDPASSRIFDLGGGSGLTYNPANFQTMILPRLEHPEHGIVTFANDAARQKFVNAFQQAFTNNFENLGNANMGKILHDLAEADPDITMRSETLPQTDPHAIFDGYGNKMASAAVPGDWKEQIAAAEATIIANGGTPTSHRDSPIGDAGDALGIPTYFNADGVEMYGTPPPARMVNPRGVNPAQPVASIGPSHAVAANLPSAPSSILPTWMTPGDSANSSLEPPAIADPTFG